MTRTHSTAFIALNIIGFTSATEPPFIDKIRKVLLHELFDKFNSLL